MGNLTIEVLLFVRGPYLATNFPVLCYIPTLVSGQHVWNQKEAGTETVTLGTVSGPVETPTERAELSCAVRAYRLQYRVLVIAQRVTVPRPTWACLSVTEYLLHRRSVFVTFRSALMVCHYSADWQHVTHTTGYYRVLQGIWLFI